MPWQTPTLAEVRGLVRDNIHGSLPGSDATIPNSVLRVMGDAQSALCFLTLEYVDWLSLQLLPDTSEHEWLDRHANIWLVNADGTTGRKMSTVASGTVLLTGTPNTVVPQYTLLSQGAGLAGFTYQTMQLVIIGNGPSPVPVTAIDAGSSGNMDPGSMLVLVEPPPGADGNATVETLTGGTDPETDDELRARVLQRIRQPPMGGDQNDYVQWALSVPGCTRAWCAPNEMGIGTVTVRFLMDDLRANNMPPGWPLYGDVQAMQAALDAKRPVAVKDFFVEAPIPQPIEFDIAGLTPDTPEIRAQIEASVQAMLFENASPGQTIFAAWKNFAVMSAPGVVSFRLTNNLDDVMPAPGYMAVLGDIYYAP